MKTNFMDYSEFHCIIYSAHYVQNNRADQLKTTLLIFRGRWALYSENDFFPVKITF